MRNLFEKDDVEEIIDRMNDLTISSQRQWGLMNVDQMLAHCSAALEVANGKAFPPRRLLGQAVGQCYQIHFCK